MNFKFRVWHATSGKFVENIPCNHRKDGQLYLSLQGELMQACGVDGLCDITGPNTVVQQFTGLKDRNDVEIYEGDIVRHGISTGEVFWNDSVGGFDLAWRDDEEIHIEHETFHFRTLKNSEVIGNIFQDKLGVIK